jgi:hypothetical protein
MSKRPHTWPGASLVASAAVLLAWPSQAVGASAPDLGRPFEPAPASQPLYDIKSPDEDPLRQRHIVTAADGVEIWTETWLPKASGGNVPPAALPTVLLYSPYLTRGTDPARAMPYLVERGFAFATAHVRGTGASGGCVYENSPLEADDGARVVEYLGRDAPWTNGSVGMYGGSYAGGTQVNVAAFGDPQRTQYLKAIVPNSAATAMYDTYFQDGVPWFAIAPAEQASYVVLQSLLLEPGTGGGLLQYIEKPGCQPEVFAGNLDTSGDWTPFWQRRDARLGLGNIRAATLLSQGHLDNRVPSYIVSGFFDRLPPSTPRAGLFGVWNHDFPDAHTFGTTPAQPDWERADYLPMITAWYDRYLRSIDPGVASWPAAQVQGTDGQWRSEQNWPLGSGPPGQLGLGADGALGVESPTGRSAYTESAIETTEADYPPGSAVTFQTGPVPQRLELYGMPVLDAWVSLDRDDAHLAAKLEVFGPDGRLTIPEARATGLRSAQHLDPLVDGRFAQERGRPAPVNTPVRIPLRFAATSLVVPKGARLRLTVAASVMVHDGLDAIQTGLGSVIHGPSQPSGAATRVTIHHDCRNPSVLRFRMPRASPDLLNVREKDEPAEQPLADNRPFTAPVSDAGGLATRPVCGQGPIDPQAVRSELDRRPRLRLRLGYRAVRSRAGRCARGRVRATVVGRDRRSVRRADFYLGGRLVARDRRRPFSKIVDRGFHRGGRHSHRVIARVRLRDGRRARLRARFPACGAPRGGRSV